MSVTPMESFVRSSAPSGDLSEAVDGQGQSLSRNTSFVGTPGSGYFGHMSNVSTLNAMFPKKDFFDPARNAFMKTDSRRTSNETKQSQVFTSSSSLSSCSSDNDSAVFNTGLKRSESSTMDDKLSSGVQFLGSSPQEKAKAKTLNVPQTSTTRRTRNATAVASQKARDSSAAMMERIFAYYNKMTHDQKVASCDYMRRQVEDTQAPKDSKPHEQTVKSYGSMRKTGYSEADASDAESDVSEYDQTPATGSKRQLALKVSRSSKRQQRIANSSETSSEEQSHVKDEDFEETKSRLPKSKRAQTDRTHSQAIQDTKHLFMKPQDAGLPSYTPVGSITDRYPNPSTDTTQFYTGRYHDTDKGVRVDQQAKLVMKIPHPDPNKESKIIWHHVPRNWQDPHTITVLNRWRSQAIKRHTGMKQRQKIVRYDYAEREFIRDVVLNDKDFKDASTKERPNVLTNKLNAKFFGVSLTGPELDAYRQATTDEQRARIKPSKKRALRTKASVASEYSRHIDDYASGRIPERRLTGWNIDNQSEDEDVDMEDSKVAVKDNDEVEEDDVNKDDEADNAVKEDDEANDSLVSGSLLLTDTKDTGPINSFVAINANAAGPQKIESEDDEEL
ncbi:hypothetical protein EJ05DRAFT_353287 [Pseudovirgaria hyperparasitica]|uniref:Uncharacterized protein n=1 Tax=Pseudovirgaria hyperparasitica TaxID=470096 RepID=A0A6A6W914_9PEZI|nr:uncharacterized protein EJ05DRAFT_353287 [Pseudovirgaria hyperparasitica]KAF2758514.1 hypothetical protein EJ05DRAFT_353287 [Pseudovirgaria hyperparasitica]